MALHPVTISAATPGHDRPIWFWQSPQSPFGSEAIVGNAARKDATIARLAAWGVTTLYDSYSTTVAPESLRTWNHKLKQNDAAEIAPLNSVVQSALDNAVVFTHATRMYAIVLILPASGVAVTWMAVVDGAVHVLLVEC